MPDKYACFNCGGEGKLHINNAEGNYTTGCRDCGGTGKIQIKISLEEYDRLREALAKATIDNAKLRADLVEQERINEELEQENAILRHQMRPDKIIFNPQFEKLMKEEVG